MSLSDKLQVLTVEEDGEHEQDDGILCSADFVTPVEQQFSVSVDPNKCSEDSVLGLMPIRSKRPRQDGLLAEQKGDPSLALPRQRVMSPPCIENPFRQEAPWHFAQCKRTSTGSITNSCSRYHEEFHELAEVGRGNFSCVYKALKRLDGCAYAIKRSLQPLQTDATRRRALREVQALASLGQHENVVRYFSSWFEDDYLYIQLELCEGTLRQIMCTASPLPETTLVDAMRQVLKAVSHVHAHGMVHLDLKPDNIYVQEGVYKLGDFGSAARMDASMSIDEGDARYLPLELLNDEHGQLDKADMFSLGATFYELATGSPLASSGSQFHALRHGRLSLLPGYSLPLQQLLKALMHPDPFLRPSAAVACRASFLRI